MGSFQTKNLVTLSVQEFLLYMEAEDYMREVAEPFSTMADVWDALANSNQLMPFSDVITVFEPFMDKTIRSVACQIARTAPVAKGRVLWDLLDDVRSISAVMTAEKYCQGKADACDLKFACHDARAVSYGSTRKGMAASVAASCSSDGWTVGGAANEAWMAATRKYEVASMDHCHRLLATIPNPFRLKNVVFPVTLLAQSGST